MTSDMRQSSGVADVKNCPVNGSEGLQWDNIPCLIPDISAADPDWRDSTKVQLTLSTFAARYSVDTVTKRNSVGKPL